jgi:hypothetical protein
VPTPADVTLPVSGSPGTSNPNVEGIAGVAGATRQVVASLAYPTTPRALATYTVVTGGAAVTVVTGPITGGWLTNPLSASEQGIATAESLYLSQSTTPGLVGNGAVANLYPGQNWTFGALDAGVTVMINAATSGHKFAGEVW